MGTLINAQKAGCADDGCKKLTNKKSTVAINQKHG